MGLIRVDTDVIRAINAASDLNRMIRQYIDLHRKYYNGLGNITFPDGEYVISFGKIKEDSIGVNFLGKSDYTVTRTVSEPTYDLGSGPDDLDGVLFYTDRDYTDSYTRSERVGFNLPYRFLFMEKEEIKEFLLARKKEDELKAQEVKRLKEIETLESRLKELKS